MPAHPDIATAETSLTHSGTQALTRSNPTLLPEIPATPNERTPSPLGVNANDLRGLQIIIWVPWDGATMVEFQAILDRFTLTNQWGITATARSFEGFGSLDDAVEVGITAGSLPDVLVDYGYQARHWDESGIVADQAPYISDPVWGLTGEEQADFYPGFWQEDLVGAGTKPRRLGIPYYRTAQVLFYNQSWAQELGYPSQPTTPQEFRAMACAAAENVAKNGNKSVQGKGGWLITPDPGGLAGWIFAFGGSLTNPGGTGYAFDTPETRQSLTYLKGLEDSGCAWMDAALEPQASLASRQALFVVGSLFDIPAQQAAFRQAGSLDNWGVIPFPSSTQPAVDSYGPSLVMVSSTPERQLAAWLVEEWLVYPPNQAEIVQQLGVFSTRRSSLSYFIHTAQADTQWAQALQYLPAARGEPSLPSWSVMRWALSDAASQLFSMQFRAEQIPSLTINLDSLAAEVLVQEP